MFDPEAIGVKASIRWRPREFPVKVVDSSFDDWAGNESDISLALEQSDLDSACNSLWCPYNIEWLSHRKHLVTSGRGYAVEESLTENRRSKSQNGGRDERVTHDERYVLKRG